MFSTSKIHQFAHPALGGIPNALNVLECCHQHHLPIFPPMFHPVRIFGIISSLVIENVQNYILYLIENIS
jgi:hypothetical protein